LDEVKIDLEGAVDDLRIHLGDFGLEVLAADRERLSSPTLI